MKEVDIMGFTALERRLDSALIFSNKVANNPTDDNVAALVEVRNSLQWEYDVSISTTEDESYGLRTLNAITDRISK